MRIMPDITKLEISWLKPLRALLRETPVTQAALIRAAWPDIKAVLDAGYTLRAVHAKLSEGGVNLPYSTLARYVNRLRAVETRASWPPPVAKIQRPPGPVAGTSAATKPRFDPLAVAMEALNEPRYDIRVAISDGDPTGRDLI